MKTMEIWSNFNKLWYMYHTKDFENHETLVKYNSDNWTLFCFVRVCFCLFVWNFSSLSSIFHWFGDSTIAGEWLHILTFSRHLWALSSEGSLACHTYCDMGQLFTMVISEDQWYSHLMSSVLQLSGHYVF